MSEQEIELRKSLNRYITIENSIITICFTILAIIFNKWWIIFFSALFYSRVSIKKSKEGDKKYE